MDKYEDGDIVEVRWYDIIEENHWTPIEKAQKDTLLEVKSVGWLLSQDNDCIRLAYSVTSDDECSYTVIPKGCIISITKTESAELNDFKET